jgi:hypothetical protein
MQLAATTVPVNAIHCQIIINYIDVPNQTTMNPTLLSAAWSLWRRIVFRFFFILLILIIAPWTWLEAIPGSDYLLRFWYSLIDWMVNTSNAKLFHVRPVLVPINGSGDTSYGWAQVWLFISLAAAGGLVWSVLDRKRLNYIQLNYWLCLFARYYVAFYALSYGILKIFAMQMYFPNLHQLATPLGDLLPMRLSWMFIGYSGPYQVFSGIMETIAGLLLLYRRTSTLGVLFATAVFMNVAALNLCYDIPVKIFSLQLVTVCLFLLANEINRILCFFILNKPAAVCDLYHFRYTKKWMGITRWVFKTAFVIIALILPISRTKEYYDYAHRRPAKQPVPNGIYAVTAYTLNNNSIPCTATDSLRWRDVIFENGYGSISTSDTAFRRTYNRVYFSYSLDSASQTLGFRKRAGDSLPLMRFHIETPDTSTIFLRGTYGTDSLTVALKKTSRHFQLAEKQFHWLSEYNR